MIFVSSLNENVKLADRIEKELNSKNYDTKIVNLVELDLPMYDTKKEQNDGIPQKALDLAKQMEEAQGYIFVSPEYNFSAPPVLLNMIAWISRIGDNFRVLFALKKIQLATHSGANGVDFLNTFRNQLTKLGARKNFRPILFIVKRVNNDKKIK
jgi:NAD(P)H-dependent FMN reductase